MNLIIISVILMICTTFAVGNVSDDAKTEGFSISKGNVTKKE